ncbi:hypothetical protein SKAU_G00387370 [Synaphobranchus kaupii]|uniref:Uncharacterized protein n=1 Tax=Synaphobranchus kaupii TaxID=118154 RepID=A0A9Q1EAU8_SYNKA|nr:hypothetical protein SKAU_G00387370 [Synaphobranchus kaupii]
MLADLASHSPFLNKDSTNRTRSQSLYPIFPQPSPSNTPFVVKPSKGTKLHPCFCPHLLGKRTGPESMLYRLDPKARIPRTKLVQRDAIPTNQDQAEASILHPTYHIPDQLKIKQHRPALHPTGLVLMYYMWHSPTQSGPQHSGYQLIIDPQQHQGPPVSKNLSITFFKQKRNYSLSHRGAQLPRKENLVQDFKEVRAQHSPKFKVKLPGDAIPPWDLETLHSLQGYRELLQRNGELQHRPDRLRHSHF